MFPSALKSSWLAIFFWALTAASTSLFTVLETAERYLIDSYSVSLEEVSHRHKTTPQGLQVFFFLWSGALHIFASLSPGLYLVTPRPCPQSWSWASARWRGGAGAWPGPAPSGAPGTRPGPGDPGRDMRWCVVTCDITERRTGLHHSHHHNQPEGFTSWKLFEHCTSVLGPHGCPRKPVTSFGDWVSSRHQGLMLQIWETYLIGLMWPWLNQKSKYKSNNCSLFVRLNDKFCRTVYYENKSFL